MPPQPASIHAIADWVREQASAERVEHGHLFEHEETLFRVFLRESWWPHPEFTIVDAVFEDNTVDVIETFIVSERLIERSLHAPGFRFRLGRDGSAPDVEYLVVDCDGRKYGIARGLNRIVSIYDASGRPLENAPDSPALPVRVFDRSVDKWCDDIRKWRGPGQ